MSNVPSPVTSPTLLAALGLPGSDAAWERFVSLYQPMIVSQCRKAALQDADAEDVRANVLQALVGAMKDFRYDPAKRFRGYLSTVVLNAIRRLWRDRERHPDCRGRGGEDAQERLEQIPIPESLSGLGEVIEDDLQARLEIARRATDIVRARVAAETWQAFYETTFEDRPATEVATRLGKSLQAVFQLRYRVGRMLQEEARRLMRGPEPLDPE